jgi:Carboxypeptidase regulatory-like domain
VTDMPVTTPAEVSWAEQTAGARRGRLGAPAAPVDNGPPRGQRMNLARVYFPGTADAAAARVVSVGLGEERAGIDFGLLLVATARVSGTVRDPGGTPLANTEVSLIGVNDALDAVALITPRAPVRTGADGAFVITAVPPGRYRLSAANAKTPATWAGQDLVIDGRDAEDVILSMQPGLTVSGRVVFDATTLTLPDPDMLARARVTLTPDDPTNGVIGVRARGASASIDADGAFVVPGLVPGTYRASLVMPGLRVNPAAPGDGWSLRSIVAGAADVLDHPLVIRPGVRAVALVATLTDRPTVLVGSLTDEDGHPAPGYPIIVFPADPRDRFAGSRRIAVARPATDGTFRLIGLPAGDYRASAVVDLDPADLDDPAFFEQLLPGALTITLSDGVRTVQDLRLARGR